MLNSYFKKIAWPVFVIYMALLIKFILLKMPRLFLSEVKNFGLHNIEAGKRHLDYIPFKTTWSCLSGERTLIQSVENLGGNIVGFIPLGILLPLLFIKLNTGKKVILTVFLISLTFELTQFIVGVGYCDIDDIMQNTLGGAIGWWVYKKWIQQKAPVTSQQLGLN